MYSRARFSVASFTGSWWPCARTCRGSGGQGQATFTSGWPRWGRAGRHLTSLSRSFRTRSTTSTSDLSCIQISRFCGDKMGPSIAEALAQLWACVRAPCTLLRPLCGARTPLCSPAADRPPHRLTDGLEVQGLQLLGHLFVPLSVPAIKMGGLEKPPVGGKGQQVWADAVC